MKKIFAIVLAMIMMLSMAAMAETGTITITNAAKGQTYAAFKIFDATYNDETEAVAYYTTADNQFFGIVTGEDSPFVFTDGDDGKKYVAEDTDTSAVLNWLKEKIGTNIDAITYTADYEDDGADATVEWEADYGYYYIVSSLGTTVTVDWNTPNVEVIDKNETAPVVPEGAKTVVSVEGDENNTTTANVGETVSYKVEFEATNYVTSANDQDPEDVIQITNYVVKDTATNLTIDVSTIDVTVEGVNVDATIADMPTEDAATFEFTIPWVGEDGKSLYVSPATVIVTYDAVVTASSAVTGSATNKAEIFYNDEVKINESVTEVKNFGFTVNKIDGTNDAPLTGAEFLLYEKIGENEYTAIPVVLVEDDEGNYYIPAVEGQTGVEIEAGTAVIKGLSNGDYVLEETLAPLGYNKLVGYTDEVEIENANGAELNVENLTGTALPSTGGIGTTIFYVVGGLLMAAAVVLLVTNKKMSVSK